MYRFMDDAAHLYFEPTQYANAKYDIILLATDIHDEWGWPMFGSPTGTAKKST